MYCDVPLRIYSLTDIAAACFFVYCLWSDALAYTGLLFVGTGA